jgi:hypothetical protein
MDSAEDQALDFVADLFRAGLERAVAAGAWPKKVTVTRSGSKARKTDADATSTRV